MRHIDASNIPHAGSGRNYAEAVAPAYLETEQGRVGLVAGTMSARSGSRAGEQRPDINGRPGVNLLRWVSEWTVDDAAFQTLQRVAQEFGWSQSVPGWWRDAFGSETDGSERLVYLFDRNVDAPDSEDPFACFAAGDTFGRRSRIHSGDLRRNVESVTEARRMADWVIYSIHNHDDATPAVDSTERVRGLAHAVIDAGADVVVGHGPHRDGGIEIYQGRPILYSLGNFIKQNFNVERQPADSYDVWGLGHDRSVADLFDSLLGARNEDASRGTPPTWQSAIVVATFEDGELSELRLHPTECGYGLSRSAGGRPLLAHGQSAAEVLTRFQDLSDPFGTRIEIEGDVGVINVRTAT
jgi:poly-gamma-glutamate synthesis protein (capsule biosynthesis protein)